MSEKKRVFILKKEDLDKITGGVGGDKQNSNKTIDYETASQKVCEHFELRENAEGNVCGYCKFFQSDCTCSQGYYPLIMVASHSPSTGGLGF